VAGRALDVGEVEDVGTGVGSSIGSSGPKFRLSAPLTGCSVHDVLM